MGSCRIYYRDIGDYLTREQKLVTIQADSLHSIDWTTLTPNNAGDWINQRNETFATYPTIGGKKNNQRETTVFTTYSGGLKTNRDAWVCNFSRGAVESNMTRMINFYNSQVDTYAQLPANARPSVNDFIDTDPTKISWDRADRERLPRGIRYQPNYDRLVKSTYRPFCKQWAYFDRQLNNTVYQLPSIFPTPHHKNEGFYVVGAGSAISFGVIMLDVLPNFHVTGAGSGGWFFPRWAYEKIDPQNRQLSLGAASDVDDWGYRRIDNITDAIHTEYQSAFGNQVSKDDIFYYTYGLLHSPQYRETYAADLKRMLPRIPPPATREKFRIFSKAGRRLADLHVNYETVELYCTHSRKRFEVLLNKAIVNYGVSPKCDGDRSPIIPPSSTTVTSRSPVSLSKHIDTCLVPAPH